MKKTEDRSILVFRFFGSILIINTKPRADASISRTLELTTVSPTWYIRRGYDHVASGPSFTAGTDARQSGHQWYDTKRGYSVKTTPTSVV